MRASLALPLALSCCLLAACSEQDPPALYLQTDYQVRCIGCQPQAIDDMPREIQAIDGADGFSVDCHVIERGGDRVVSFSAMYVDPEQSSRNYAISVTQAPLEGDPGSGCIVSVSEGANTYEGRCTADEPTEDQPCRIDLMLEGDVITGTVLCADVPNRASGMLRRHVVAPRSEDPAELEVHGCEGL